MSRRWQRHMLPLQHTGSMGCKQRIELCPLESQSSVLPLNYMQHDDIYIYAQGRARTCDQILFGETLSLLSYLCT